jgi:hypothetical protein
VTHEQAIDMDDPSRSSAPSAELWSTGLDVRLRDFLRTAVDKGFEPAAAELHRTRSNLVEPLNRLVAWAMLLGSECRFSQREDRYDELLALPAFTGKLAVITVNYDILLEEALARASRKFRYPGIRDSHQANGGLPVYKLHGSINWLQARIPAVSATYQVAQQISAASPPVTLSGPDKGVETQLEYVPAGSRENLILELKHNGSAGSPILAVYAPGKPVPYNYECVASVQRECLDALRSNPKAGATIIGLFIPPVGDDPRIDEVVADLTKRGGRVEYVAKGTEEKERATHLGFKAIADTLEGYLQGRRRSRSHRQRSAPKNVRR